MGIDDIKQQGARLKLWQWEKLPDFIKERYDDPIQFMRERKPAQQLYSKDGEEFKITEVEVTVFGDEERQFLDE